ncbi:MAG: 30S ribosomal protein S16 [Candidatus Harrisonbacteria bacterium]|nr:30S ribosomal protein S16 [Candidatus Harrisonbacteria bacterium]
MLMIRLQRRGKKHQAAYRVVVGEKRSKLLGKQTDDLGWYDPHSAKLDLNKDRLQHWLSAGAKMSDTVNNLLVSAGMVPGKKIAVHKKAQISGGQKSEAAPAVAETPKTETSK